MILNSVFKFILRRPFLRGQDRIFNFLFTRNKFAGKSVITVPLEGNFKINCDVSTWIGAKIAFTGDYESDLKRVFKSVIKAGDHILDIGANIGFHTLYFAELTGPKGMVTAFEPVPHNFKSLTANILLNHFENIQTKNIALGNKNENIRIIADETSNNPGAYNLFDLAGDTIICCRIGDEIVNHQKIDVIKIDVEGYESFVLDGLTETIRRDKPKIVFEFDQHYHQKTGRKEDYIFNQLAKLGYHFKYIDRNGLKDVNNFSTLVSGNILALSND